MYVYKQSEPGLYTVGFYGPNGKWEPESDHTSIASAASRVNFLNGASEPEPVDVPELECANCKLEMYTGDTYYLVKGEPCCNDAECMATMLGIQRRIV